MVQETTLNPNQDNIPLGDEALSMKALLEAGVHFGHQTHRWNPQMRRFIFAQRNGIHIVDLQHHRSTTARVSPVIEFAKAIALHFFKEFKSC